MSQAYNEYSAPDDPPALALVDQLQPGHIAGIIPRPSVIQPDVVEPIHVFVGEKVGRVEGRPLKFTANQQVILRELADHRSQPIGWKYFGERRLLSPSPAESTNAPLLSDIVRRLNLLEPVVERSLLDTEVQYRLSDDVIYAGDAKPGDVLQDYIVQDPHWRDKAACIHEPAASFEIPSIKNPDPQNVRKRLCGPCPVRSDCGADAIRMGVRGVIRGGMVEKEYTILSTEYRAYSRSSKAQKTQPASLAENKPPATPNPSYAHITRPVTLSRVPDELPVIAPLFSADVSELPAAAIQHVSWKPQIGADSTAEIFRQGSLYGQFLGTMTAIESMDELRALGAPVDNAYYASLRGALPGLRAKPPTTPKY